MIVEFIIIAWWLPSFAIFTICQLIAERELRVKNILFTLVFTLGGGWFAALFGVSLLFNDLSQRPNSFLNKRVIGGKKDV